MNADSRFLFGMALTGFVMAFAVLVGPRIVLALLCDRDADRKILDAQSDFFCSENHKIVYDAWSECGLMKVCTDAHSGAKDGSQFAAQGGRLLSKALCSQGRVTSGWTWYDSEGKPHSEKGGYQVPVQAGGDAQRTRQGQRQ
jgi:hypothetical protein